MTTAKTKNEDFIGWGTSTRGNFARWWAVGRTPPFLAGRGIPLPHPSSPQ